MVKQKPLRTSPRRFNIAPLLFNHMDAWGVTAAIVTAALSVHQQFTPRGLLLLGTITLTYWFGFALNDYFDVAVDRLDPAKAKRNFFVLYAVPREITAVITTIITLILIVSYAQFGVRGLLMMGIGFPIAWAYSAPPFRLKSIPLLDLAVHALFVQTFPYITVLTLLHIQWQPVDYLVVATFMLTSLSSQFEQQVRDVRFDAQVEQNFTTTFGLPLTQFLLRLCCAAVFVLFSVGFVAQIIPILYFPFALITLPLLIQRFLQPHKPRSRSLVKLLTIAGLGYAGLLLVLHVV